MGWTEDLSAPKKAVEDFLAVHFSCVTVVGRVVDSNMNGFCRCSGNLFAILIYYVEVGDVGLGVVVENTVFVNCTFHLTKVKLAQRQ